MSMHNAGPTYPLFPDAGWAFGNDIGLTLATWSITGNPAQLAAIGGYFVDTGGAAGVIHYVQLHDKATAPAAGNVPKIVIPVIGSGVDYPTFSWALNLPVLDVLPDPFTLGIGLGLSTTAATYTAAANGLLSWWCYYSE